MLDLCERQRRTSMRVATELRGGASGSEASTAMQYISLRAGAQQFPRIQSVAEIHIVTQCYATLSYLSVISKLVLGYVLDRSFLFVTCTPFPVHAVPK